MGIPAVAVRQAVLDVLQSIIYIALAVVLFFTLRTTKRAAEGAKQIEHIHASDLLQSMSVYMIAGVLFLALRAFALFLTSIFYLADPDGALDDATVDPGASPLLIVSLASYSSASALFWVLRALIFCGWVAVIFPRKVLLLQSVSMGCGIAFAIFLSVKTALMSAARLSRGHIFGNSSENVATSLSDISAAWDIGSAVVFGASAILLSLAIRYQIRSRPPPILLDAAAKIIAASFVVEAFVFIFCNGPCQHDPNHQPGLWGRNRAGGAEIIAVIAEAVPAALLIFGLRRNWLKQYQQYANSDSAAGLEMLSEAAWQMHLESAPPPMPPPSSSSSSSDVEMGGRGGGGRGMDIVGGGGIIGRDNGALLEEGQTRNSRFRRGGEEESSSNNNFRPGSQEMVPQIPRRERENDVDDDDFDVRRGPNDEAEAAGGEDKKKKKKSLFSALGGGGAKKKREKEQQRNDNNNNEEEEEEEERGGGGNDDFVPAWGEGHNEEEEGDTVGLLGK